MMLDYRPELVRMEEAAAGRCDDEFYLPENVGRSQMESFLYGIQTQSPNGILGDPVGSTADAGERAPAARGRIAGRALRAPAATSGAGREPIAIPGV